MKESESKRIRKKQTALIQDRLNYCLLVSPRSRDRVPEPEERGVCPAL